MAFLMVPPPQITPRMPRERRGNFLDLNVGNDFNNNALVLAVLQMLLQQKSEERRTSLEEKIAGSTIETQKLQREMVMRAETETRLTAARTRADQAQQARRKEILEKFSRSQDEIDRQIIQERYSGSRDSATGKEILDLARQYAQGGNTKEAVILDDLGGLPSRFQKEFNAAGSDAARFGLTARLQSELSNLRSVAGSNSAIVNKIDDTLESLTSAIAPFAQDDAGMNRYISRSRTERERALMSELDARSQVVQDEASRLSEVPNVTPEDFQRRLRGAVTTAYSGLSLPERVHPRLDIEPGEVRPVTRPAPVGILPRAAHAIAGAPSELSEILFGGLPTTTGEPNRPDVSGSLLGLQAVWGWLNKGKHIAVKNRQAVRGLSGYDPVSVTPQPLAMEETYTEDGWLKTPVPPGFIPGFEELDAFWNP